MKPTLKDIEDNYERVLLRLHSGELAGIVDNNTLQLQVLRKTHWIDKAINTSDLDNSYNGTNLTTDFNIDAIAFLSNKSLVNDAILYGCGEIIDWDWDINNPQCDDQMDAYTYSMFETRYHIDDIIKGDNKTMNNILDIYGDRKREKINKHYEQLMEQTKLADERYVIFKDCSNKLDKLYKEDGIITNYLVEPRLAEKTKKHLEELAELREEEYCKLDNKIKEVNAQLSMCETYDQKQEILRIYNIINKNGKVNG